MTFTNLSSFVVGAAREAAERDRRKRRRRWSQSGSGMDRFR